jgi:hypothetical protein
MKKLLLCAALLISAQAFGASMSIGEQEALASARLDKDLYFYNVLKHQIANSSDHISQEALRQFNEIEARLTTKANWLRKHSYPNLPEAFAFHQRMLAQLEAAGF